MDTPEKLVEHVGAQQDSLCDADVTNPPREHNCASRHGGTEMFPPLAGVQGELGEKIAITYLFRLCNLILKREVYPALGKPLIKKRILTLDFC